MNPYDPGDFGARIHPCSKYHPFGYQAHWSSRISNHGNSRIEHRCTFDQHLADWYLVLEHSESPECWCAPPWSCLQFSCSCESNTRHHPQRAVCCLTGQFLEIGCECSPGLSAGYLSNWRGNWSRWAYSSFVERLWSSSTSTKNFCFGLFGTGVASDHWRDVNHLVRLCLACSDSYCSYAWRWSSDQISARWTTVETQKTGRLAVGLPEFVVNCLLSIHFCCMRLNYFAGFGLRHCEDWELRCGTCGGLGLSFGDFAYL